MELIAVYAEGYQGCALNAAGLAHGASSHLFGASAEHRKRRSGGAGAPVQARQAGWAAVTQSCGVIDCAAQDEGTTPRLEIWGDMSWFMANKDLVGIALATMAIALSTITVIVSRRQQQTNAFLQVQQLLLAQDLQHGRRLVYGVGNGWDVPPYGSVDLHQVDRAMGMLDLLGTFVRRRIVRRAWVLDFWHRALRNLRPGYDAVVRLHSEHWFRGVTPWPDLADLIERSERYNCRQPCCTSPTDGKSSHDLRQDFSPDELEIDKSSRSARNVGEGPSGG